jgi:hypothetical protein
MPKLDFQGHASLAEIEQDEGPPPATPADALFTTTQRRLLGLLYGQPDIEFHTGELIAISGSGAGATQRELKKLEMGGLLRSRKRRARKYYQANKDCCIYPELAAMVRQTFGLAAPLRAAFGLMADQIQICFVFDGFLNEQSPRAPLELLLVSESITPACEDLDVAIEVAQVRLRRGLLVQVIGSGELKEPRWFLGQALAQPRVWVFGNERRLAAMTSGP